jgi:hypothetical protein
VLKALFFGPMDARQSRMDLLFTLPVIGVISSQIVDVLIGQLRHNPIHIGINPFQIPEIA